MPKTVMTREESIVAINEGKKLFSQNTHEAQQEAFNYWKNALESSEALSRGMLEEFLADQEEVFYTSLLGAESSVEFLQCLTKPWVHRNPTDAALTIKTWSIKDTNHYYNQRIRNQDIMEIHTKRRTLIISQQPITDFDDYQLLRDKDHPHLIQKRLEFIKLLAPLKLIGQLHSLLDKTSPRRTGDEFYADYLLKISAFLRDKIVILDTQEAERNKELAKTQQEAATKIEAKPEEVIPEIVCLIDAINENIALLNLKYIANNELEANKIFIRALHQDIQAMDQEIFPWLAIHFKKHLLNNPQTEAQAIANFQAFHKLKFEQKSLAECMSLLTGSSPDTRLSMILKGERLQLQIIRSLPFTDKLNRILNYASEPTLSDWLALQLCDDIVRDSAVHGLNPVFITTVNVFIRCVKKAEYFLLDANQYLTEVVQKLNSDPEALATMRLTCPTLMVTLLLDIHTALAYDSLPPNYLPAFAKYFHEINALQHGPAMLQAILEQYDLETRIGYFNTLFKDTRFNDKHIQYLASSEAQALGLTLTQFPLLALHYYYLVGENTAHDLQPIALWEALLDTNDIAFNDFFITTLNRELFEKIATVKTELIQTAKILEHPKRYQQLATALSVYSSLFARVTEAYWFSSADIVFNNKSKWAIDMLSSILRRVAYPEGHEMMNFKNVVTFLQLTLDPPRTLSMEGNLLSETLQESSMEFFVSHPHVRADQVRLLVHGFIQLYKQEVNSHPARELNASYGAVLSQIPSLCLMWFDYFYLGKLVVPAVFIPTLKKNQFEVVTQSAHAIQQWTGLNRKVKLESILLNANDDIKKSALEGFDKASGYKDYTDAAINFSRQLYYAYCQSNQPLIHQADQETQQLYLNFIINFEIPQKLSEAIEILLNDISNYLKKEATPNSPKITLTNNFLTRVDPAVIANEIFHLNTILEKLKKAYERMGQSDALVDLLHTVNLAINTNTFNKNWLLKDPYHTYLLALKEQLSSLRLWQRQRLVDLQSEFSSQSSNSYQLISQGLGISAESKSAQDEQFMKIDDEVDSGLEIRGLLSPEMLPAGLAFCEEIHENERPHDRQRLG